MSRLAKFRGLRVCSLFDIFWDTSLKGKKDSPQHPPRGGVQGLGIKKI